MKTIKEIINWFNNKKTIIGLMGTNIMQMDLQFLTKLNPDIKMLLLWAFGLLASGGLVHKYLKNKNEMLKK